MAEWARRWWTTATYGARNPGRRTVALAVCGVVSGFGEGLVVVLVVALVSRGDTDAAPLLGDLPGTGSLAGLTLGLVAGLALTHLGAAWISARSATDVQRTVQSRLMTAHLDAPWSMQSSLRTGELQELVTLRTQVLAFGTQQLAQAVSAALNLLAVATVAVAVSPAVTGGLVLAIGIVVAISFAMRDTRRHAVREAADSQASLAVELTETALLARELRAFGVESAAGQEATSRIEESARRYGRARLVTLLTPTLTRDATIALLVVALAVVVATSDIETAVLGAVVVLILRALAHAQSLSSIAVGWTEREDAVQRVDDRLTAWRAPAARGTERCRSVTRLAARAVSFTYKRADEPALRDVDLELHRGELVGVIGRTGAGKSTLAGVLLGFLSATGGEVRVDDTPLANLDPASWHARTAWVGQEPRLLTGTVGDNIRFLRADLDEAAVTRAAAEAGLDLPLDQDTGPAGAALSGGQRQRIALARALAGRPDVVVLDEPTSALDVKTENIVRETLERLREDRIVVVIAHRLSTVRTCDRIVLMESGRVRVMGGPEHVARGDEAWLRDALVG